mmetsp:Transcript_18589/g.37612  ORF Transcript_18589/g.37612 Transcript_18589/m.37612 type:complete len:297 (-) Transcript_18589:167-1057(-)
MFSQRPRGHTVYPCGSNSLDRVPGNHAGSLQHRSSPELFFVDLHGLAHVFQREIIEHHDVCPRPYGLSKFLYVLRLDLHSFGGCERSGLLHCGTNPPACRDVVLLDQESVPQTQPVVVPTPAEDRVLLSNAETWYGLSCIQNLEVRACPCLSDKLPGGGCSSRKGLEEIQRTALSRQDAPSFPTYSEDNLSGLDFISVSRVPLQSQERVHLSEDFVDVNSATHSAVLVGDYPGRHLRVLSNQTGGDVTDSNVLIEGSGDNLSDETGMVSHKVPSIPVNQVAGHGEKTEGSKVAQSI